MKPSPWFVLAFIAVLCLCQNSGTICSSSYVKNGGRSKILLEIDLEKLDNSSWCSFSLVPQVGLFKPSFWTLIMLLYIT
jgi:hypothetical protein